MFKKLINRNESNQIETDNSALRDIIPSNDDVIPKKSRHKRLSRLCKAVLIIFILGLIAIGIVVLALILAYSHNAFMNFIIPSSVGSLIPLSNNTRLLEIHQQNLTATSDKQNWNKLTSLPIHNNQQIHILSSVFKIKQENEHLSADTSSMKSNTMIPEQTTMSNKQSTFLPSTTMEVHEDVQTSLNNRMIRDHQTTTPEKTSSTTHIDFQSSTNKYRKKFFSSKNIEQEEDDVIDDLTFF